MKTFWQYTLTRRQILRWIPLLLILLVSQISSATEIQKIGVLAARGTDKALEKWSATADYLSASIPGYRFQIIPLNFDEISEAVEKQQIDFVLANPAIYVQLENNYGVSRIATMKNQVAGRANSFLGGVIFSRADLPNFNEVKDIKGRRLTAVDETSLGGFQTAWRELDDAGINPFKDTTSIIFAGTHDAVVHAVLNGETDIGIVRTDTLERMASEGKIDLKDIKVLMHTDEMDSFPYLHSTRLYPEWPMAKLKHTSLLVAEKVARALLNMPVSSKAARLSETEGWTIPLNYQKVRELLKQLKLPPYAPGPVTMRELLEQHRIVVMMVFGGLFLVSFYSVLLIVMNRKLKSTSVKLAKSRDELESRVLERTRDLHEKENELEALFETIPSVVFVKDANTLSYVKINRACENLLGKSRDEIIGRTDYDFFSTEQADIFTKSDSEVLSTRETVDVDMEPILTPEGTRFLHTRKACVFDDQGNPKYLLGIANDVTERKETLEKLEHMATHDALTGLYNRRVLTRRLTEEINRVERYQSALSVLMLDIDHFKKVNDRYGHQVGDQVLIRLTETINSTIRKTDYAARYGGEEFAIILPYTNQQEATELSERLRITVEQDQIIADHNTIAITVSIGIAVTPHSNISSVELLKRADQALYQAKDMGRNRVQAFGDQANVTDEQPC